ncbi:MAG: hypothetical protein PUC06_07745 [Oscillospiraceae bacterium]|nr:hypothetical protein [Oscillospiraceae bacterium]
MERDYPVRKRNRLQEYDYSQNGAYFITFCTEGKKALLCRIVGDGVLDVPEVRLSQYGQIVKEQIEAVNSVYSNSRIDKYVIMPNHVHLIVSIGAAEEGTAYSGTSRTPSPTNAEIPRMISTIKRICNRRIGRNIWQRSFHDHIIRNDEDYGRIWLYIDNNPLNWEKDCFYLPLELE